MPPARRTSGDTRNGSHGLNNSGAGLIATSGPLAHRTAQHFGDWAAGVQDCFRRIEPDARPHAVADRETDRGATTPWTVLARPAEEAGSEGWAPSDMEIGGSFEAAAAEINASFRLRLLHARRTAARHEVPLAIRLIREWRAVAIDALRREFKKKRRAVFRHSANAITGASPSRGAVWRKWRPAAQPHPT
jgi:hypothetical protein